jgi:hypothetical protein
VFCNLDLTGIVDVLYDLAEIAHVEPPAATRAFHVMVDLNRCGIVDIAAGMARHSVGIRSVIGPLADVFVHCWSTGAVDLGLHPLGRAGRGAWGHRQGDAVRLRHTVTHRAFSAAILNGDHRDNPSVEFAALDEAKFNPVKNKFSAPREQFFEQHQ